MVPELLKNKKFLTTAAIVLIIIVFVGVFFLFSKLKLIPSPETATTTPINESDILATTSTAGEEMNTPSYSAQQSLQPKNTTPTTTPRSVQSDLQPKAAKPATTPNSVLQSLQPKK